MYNVRTFISNLNFYNQPNTTSMNVHMHVECSLYLFSNYQMSRDMYCVATTPGIPLHVTNAHS